MRLKVQYPKNFPNSGFMVSGKVREYIAPDATPPTLHHTQTQGKPKNKKTKTKTKPKKKERIS